MELAIRVVSVVAWLLLAHAAWRAYRANVAHWRLYAGLALLGVAGTMGWLVPNDSVFHYPAMAVEAGLAIGAVALVLKVKPGQMPG